MDWLTKIMSQDTVFFCKRINHTGAAQARDVRGNML